MDSVVCITIISFNLNNKTRVLKASKCLTGANPVIVTVSIPDIQLIIPIEMIKIIIQDKPGNDVVPKKVKLS